MKCVYTVLIKKTTDGLYVFIPDWDIHTQGVNILDAVEMARDAIGIMGIELEDEGKSLPKAKDYEKESYDYISFVDVDFKKYRQKLKSTSVRKNCTIPSWLNDKAEKAGVNFSKVLQDALIATLEN